MFGKVTVCARGVMIEYDGAWCLVQGLGCNPFIEVREFAPAFHTNITRQVYVPPEYYAVLAAVRAR